MVNVHSLQHQLLLIQIMEHVNCSNPVIMLILIKRLALVNQRHVNGHQQLVEQPQQLNVYLWIVLELQQVLLAIHSKVSMAIQILFVFWSMEHVQPVIRQLFQQINAIRQQQYIHILGMNQQINVFHANLPLTTIIPLPIQTQLIQEQILMIMDIYWELQFRWLFLESLHDFDLKIYIRKNYNKLIKKQYYYLLLNRV